MSQEPSLFDLDSAPPSPNSSGEDAELESVYAWFLSQKDYSDRFGEVLRKSIDEVLDGQRTGRYDLSVSKGEGRVEKTEKTYLGTKVEIVARAEFELGYGSPMDYTIEGTSVDAKFTSGSNWAIPREAIGHICLLMAANDQKGVFQVGLLRTTMDTLNLGENGDGKRTVSAFGRKKIRWMIPNGKLPKNFLLNLKKNSPHILESIWGVSNGYKGSRNGGQARVNNLFRLLPGELLDRTTVVTVAMQHDGPKRVRDARGHLKSSGYIILGHLKPAPQIASDLGLPIPNKGSWVSARLTHVHEDDDRPSTVIDGLRYGLWREGDMTVTAPTIAT